MSSERTKQEATERANADRKSRRLSGCFKVSDFSSISDMAEDVFRRVAAEAIDELHAIKADMAGIDRLLQADTSHSKHITLRDAGAIAARYREVDPLLIEAQDLYANWADKSGVEIALAALKRGIELGKGS